MWGQIMDEAVTTIPDSFQSLHFFFTSCKWILRILQAILEHSSNAFELRTPATFRHTPPQSPALETYYRNNQAIPPPHDNNIGTETMHCALGDDYFETEEIADMTSDDFFTDGDYK
ncbi:hypothetical protein CLAFUW4_09967 [Fulvia fulva]|uniref:Uncharacterized protein n=1 Tax=Passalora fulva TaxID=5499 RepID=A0A9Q8PI65_PASFU|nr:uncharacterized protein CLAFUR5_12276 [Fulvia fulva]KAK4615558.1 hypothetical protein CLAFUR4_09971 [Fulvia fulva]KAK4617230.1 hypothetical protein CLAFUR0_09968 [Fulvia fulva]UJO22882.1 hypothetical protein CLAFUR5_12276 [Fulvia fulva]WPV19105.1 hypothetical protein CLAFUW4_09967 [Fulvia fulva]WPV34147.1 hypothetical protein CLAFUW7_09968 [Fulvia fulva]